MLYNVRVGVRYHMRRQAFFERWHRLTGIISLIGGSTAVATITHEFELAGLIAGAVIAIAQSIDLMVDTRKYGELHRDLRCKYLALEPRLTLVDLPPEKCHEIDEAIKNIEAEEPPIRTALMDIVQNDTLIAEGYTKDTAGDAWSEINFFRRIFAQVW